MTLNLLDCIINLDGKKMKNIVVKDKIINVTGVNDDDHVSLTDIARFKTDGETNLVIANWM